MSLFWPNWVYTKKKFLLSCWKCTFALEHDVPTDILSDLRAALNTPIFVIGISFFQLIKWQFFISNFSVHYSRFGLTDGSYIYQSEYLSICLLHVVCWRCLHKLLPPCTLHTVLISPQFNWLLVGYIAHSPYCHTKCATIVVYVLYLFHNMYMCLFALDKDDI